ncbi:protein HAIKU1-like [Vigna radiata var. radiata]|uniref:Protein HAIKU1-like n=1 Tax=Vigna radiata var. radiata TaxID=3916 RepID=A0A1S3UJ01_VIGRR|nr:protein HAIKU1-like [Vigna radiata var. radiata]XP_014506017.1 protein HAIKU1-like [Vigna radiata var. radiata]
MDNSKNRHNDSLGVNKTGKNIRKSPLHQPNYGSNSNVNGARQQQQQPQPHVYNISKNEFRDIVQQLTGSPSQDPPSKPPQSNSPKPQSIRLQKIRPPPLPYVRPPLPASYSNNNSAPRPAQFRQPSPNPFSQPNAAESPISAYVRYLEHSLTDPGSKGTQVQPLRPSSALLHNNPMFPSPRLLNATAVVPVNGLNPLPPPPPLHHHHGVPSPQTNGPPILPSPTSQFPLPSPNGYMNFLSPQSAHPPLLSPGIQFPSPFTPNFPFSPFGQSGIFGPGQQPPLSPGIFPLSPSGFFPITSPRW